MRFCSLFQGFQGFSREENPCFFRGTLLQSFVAKKKQGLEDQGSDLLPVVFLVSQGPLGWGLEEGS